MGLHEEDMFYLWLTNVTGMDGMSSSCSLMLLFIGLLDLDRLCGALEGRYSVVDQ